jgi:hypothetical protein
MKSRIPEVAFVELPLKVFARRFPELMEREPLCFLDLNDSEYIVRFSDKGLEFGYASDEWTIC